MNILNPTEVNYASFQDAYDFFNAELFEGRLPSCLITFQRKGRTLGFFAGERFGTRDGNAVTDEIALNPKHFIGRSDAEIISTLIHEMTHLEHAHFGEPPRRGYHDKAWAALMERIGLIPSDTGRPGGRKTGQKVSHYIEPGGRFEKAFAKFVKKEKFSVPYIDIWRDASGKAKLASKTKYTCPGCGFNAWAKSDANLICGDCKQTMIVPKAEA